MVHTRDREFVTKVGKWNSLTTESLDLGPLVFIHQCGCLRPADETWLMVETAVQIKAGLVWSFLIHFILWTLNLFCGYGNKVALQSILRFSQIFNRLFFFLNWTQCELYLSLIPSLCFNSCNFFMKTSFLPLTSKGKCIESNLKIVKSVSTKSINMSKVSRRSLRLSKNFILQSIVKLEVTLFSQAWDLMAAFSFMQQKKKHE